jgi:hypothetical protein
MELTPAEIRAINRFRRSADAEVLRGLIDRTMRVAIIDYEHTSASEAQRLDILASQSIATLLFDKVL